MQRLGTAAGENPGFTKKIDKVVNDAIAHPGQASLVHGDAHPGNFFWDQASEQLTAIDTPTMHYSMGELMKAIATDDERVLYNNLQLIVKLLEE